ncbi:hypothetical protein GVAV_001117 [Gurleya vavrai]
MERKNRYGNEANQEQASTHRYELLNKRKFKCLSIYCCFIKGRPLPLGSSDIKNSWVTRRINNEKPFSEDKTIKCKYIVDNTSIELERKIFFLETLEQDVIKWCEDFRTIMKLCKWNEEASISILLGTIADEIRKKLILKGQLILC